MTDYEVIRKDLYESFHDTFHKLYISELKDQIADKDEVITANDHVIVEQQAEIERLRAALRDAYEVYAGSEGFIAETCAESYQRQIIKKMVDCISAALSGDKHE